MFLGPPGAGKATQTIRAAAELGVPPIVLGVIFREAIANATPMGRQIGQFVASGLLVPDKLTNAIVSERLTQSDCEDGFVLDGYPRSLSQARSFDLLLQKNKIALRGVLFFDVESLLLVDRLSQRRLCSQCASIYNLHTHPPVSSGVCDTCGGSLIQRSDDTPAAIAKRLEEYREKVKPLLEFYEKKGVLIRIKAIGTVDEIAQSVSAVFRRI